MTRTLLVLALDQLGLGWLLWKALPWLAGRLDLYPLMVCVGLVGALWAGAFGCALMCASYGVAAAIAGWRE
jgi:hypothetical protein